MIVIDPAGRTLLFRGSDPYRPEAGTWWFTPGGGLQTGETVHEAARRELREETGLLVDVVGTPVHVRRTRFEFEGSTYDQEEHFFVAAVDVPRLDDSGWTDVERRVIVEHRWWTLGELRTTSQTVYPEELPGLLTELLAGN